MASNKKYLEGLRAKTSEALRTELAGLLRESFNLRMQKGSGQLSRPDRIRAVRRNIAKLKTVLQEKAS